MSTPDEIASLRERMASLDALTRAGANNTLQLQAEIRALITAVNRAADRLLITQQDIAEIKAQLVTMLPATLNAAQRAADNTGSFKLMKPEDSGKHAAVSLFREFRKAPRSTQILTTVIAVVAAVALIFHAVR